MPRTTHASRSTSQLPFQVFLFRSTTRTKVPSISNLIFIIVDAEVSRCVDHFLLDVTSLYDPRSSSRNRFRCLQDHRIKCLCICVEFERPEFAVQLVTRHRPSVARLVTRNMFQEARCHTINLSSFLQALCCIILYHVRVLLLRNSCCLYFFQLR